MGRTYVRSGALSSLATLLDIGYNNKRIIPVDIRVTASLGKILTFSVRRPFIVLLNIEQDVKVSDTSKADSSKGAGISK